MSSRDIYIYKKLNFSPKGILIVKIVQVQLQIVVKLHKHQWKEN
jgi:hypothetical protein